MFKIVIDPGHGEFSNKGVIAGYYEGRTMFNLAGYLRDELLRYHGVDVQITRSSVQADPDLAERGAMYPGANVFLSLHSNAAARPEVWGSEIYDSLIIPNKKLADALGLAISKEMEHSYRGTLYRKNDDGSNTDWYGVIRSAMRNGAYCALLIEHGFHTNPHDCKWLMDASNLKQLAAIEARTIANHYGLQLEYPADTPTMYRVQVGAFTLLANAERLRSRLIQKGYQSYVKPLDITGYYRVQAGAFSNERNALAMVERLKNDGFNAIIKKGV